MTLSSHFLFGTDYVDRQGADNCGITFSHLEVTEDLSLLISSDTSSNLYVVNMDEYFDRFPQHCNRGDQKKKLNCRRIVRFEYDAEDEDAVTRNPQISSVVYGDRVWKTELWGLRKHAEQRALTKSSGQCLGLILSPPLIQLHVLPPSLPSLSTIPPSLPSLSPPSLPPSLPTSLPSSLH